MLNWCVKIGDKETTYTSYDKMRSEFNAITKFVETNPDVKCYDDFPDEYKTPMLYLSYNVSEDMYERYKKNPCRYAYYGGFSCNLHECFNIILNNNCLPFEWFIKFLELNNAEVLCLNQRGKYLFDCEYEIGKAFYNFEYYIKSYNWSIGFKPKYDAIINDLNKSSVVFAIFDKKDFSTSNYKEYRINNVNDLTKLINSFKNELVYTHDLGHLNSKELKQVGNEWFKLTESQQYSVYELLIKEYKSSKGYISHTGANPNFSEVFIGFKQFDLPSGLFILFKESFINFLSKSLYNAFDKAISGWARHFSVDNPNDYAYFGWSLD